MAVEHVDGYRAFTVPAELHKAVNTLRGMVAGITTDLAASDEEIQELIHWCSLHVHLRNKHPFNELLPLIEGACSDGIIESEEARDIIWLCNNFISDVGYYDLLTSSVQFLSGLLHGVMADGELSDAEIHALRKWVNVNGYLQGCYPFDEIYSLLSEVLADGNVTDDERNMLKGFFSNFIDMKVSLNLREPQLTALREQYSIQGICAICPEIVFPGRIFAFTGESYKCTRKEIERVIADLGGTCRSNVSTKTDYLIVGNAGNPCWAFACYGRKIEEAVQLRKDGRKVMIVNETDFWDAVADIG